MAECHAHDLGTLSFCLALVEPRQFLIGCYTLQLKSATYHCINPANQRPRSKFEKRYKHDPIHSKSKSMEQTRVWIIPQRHFQILFPVKRMICGKRMIHYVVPHFQNIPKLHLETWVPSRIIHGIIIIWEPRNQRVRFESRWFWTVQLTLTENGRSWSLTKPTVQFQPTVFFQSAVYFQSQISIC